jgi:hypothetical protein
MSASDPVTEGFNTGPDGEHFPFGWLGAESKIGDMVLIEVRDDRDHYAPDSYVIYAPDREFRAGRLRRVTQSWHTLSESLVAIAMLREGVDPNTLAHAVPLLIGGFKAVGDETKASA